MRPGRPKTTENELALRRALAKALQPLWDEKWGSTTRLAERAGVTKQSMALYLEGEATPTQDTLRRICTNLQIPHLDVNGVRIVTSDLPKRKPRSVPQQLSLSLSDAILTVAKRHLEVEVLKKRTGGIDLKVSINFAPALPAAKGQRRKALAS